MIQRLQNTDSVVMIRPKYFGYNEMTAKSNFFQNKDSAESLNIIAQNEFDRSVELLKDNGINVCAFDDRDDVITPDSIFPNNWISFLHSGQVCIFPMQAENRSVEKRIDIIESLKKEFELNEICDYSYYERMGAYLEGTGSMVFDHTNNIAYATLSSRTDENLLKSFCEEWNYKPVVFHSFDLNHQLVYHTNVGMCVGDHFCILCVESIENKNERVQVLDQLTESGKEIIEISLAQMHQFAGNMLQLTNKYGHKFIVCSQNAFACLTDFQKEHLSKYGSYIICPVNTVERVGGGSIRCMIAEVFLNKINNAF